MHRNHTGYYYKWTNYTEPNFNIYAILQFLDTLGLSQHKMLPNIA